MRRTFSVKGRVAYSDGASADGVLVALVDADPECDDLLGVGITSAGGSFCLTFTAEAFNQEAGEAEERPDLYVVASVLLEGAPVPVLRRDFPGLAWEREEDLGTLSLPLARGARPTAVPGLRPTPGSTKLVRRIRLDPEIVDVAAREIAIVVERYTGFTKLLDGVRLAIVDDGFADLERRRVERLLGRKELGDAEVEAAANSALGCDTSAMALWEPADRTVYLNRTLLEAQNYDAVRLVLGHELVHVGQSNAHPELDAELARIQADTLAHELAGTAYSAERAQEIQRFFANIEGYARYVEDRLLELYTHGTTIMGAKLAARGAIRTRKLRNAPSAFVRDDAAPTFEELLHAGMLGKRTQYTAGRDAYVARATEGAIVKFDPALRPELQLSGVAIGALELLADRGSSAALLQLALLYLQGRGVTKDLEKAKHWLRRAIDSGVAEAGVLLAGLLPIEDPERARLLRPSATQGHAEAQYILGVTLLRAGAADVPAQDREEGVLMLENAAAQGLVAAMRDLAKLYDQGLAGVPRDVVKGRLWTRRADAAEKRRPD